MIAFRDFSKRFGVVDAVTSLTLDVGEGETVALLGPNGSGKTTSIKAAAGVIRPTEGSVLVGSPGRAASDVAGRRACAFLPQRVAFPPALTGREVVEFYGALRGRGRADVDAALVVASLNGASDRAVGTYSGGMTQRLGLAVSMVAHAPILLLDEPTAALDPEGLSSFRELITRRRQAGGTVLFSSHQMGDVERLADRFAVLVRGRLVCTLTSSQLRDALADRGVLRVRLERPSTSWVDDVRAMAPDAMCADDQVIVRGPMPVRLAVLDRLRASAAGIASLEFEDGTLDALYRELVGGGS